MLHLADALGERTLTAQAPHWRAILSICADTFGDDLAGTDPDIPQKIPEQINHCLAHTVTGKHDLTFRNFLGLVYVIAGQHPIASRDVT
jgi:hypothetical protein